MLGHRNSKKPQFIVSYADEDEEFAFKELLSGLEQKYRNISVEPISENMKCKRKYTIGIQNPFKNRDNVLKIVVFSQNYLTAVYSNTNIKQIREIMNIRNTVYVFTDIGPENSIFEYLKQQRDPRISVVWNEPNFWHSLVEKIRYTESNLVNMMSLKNIGHSHKSIKLLNHAQGHMGHISRLPDSPCLSTLDSLDQSQV